MPQETVPDTKFLRGLGLLSEAQLAQAQQQLGSAGASAGPGPDTSVDSLEERLTKLKRLRDEWPA